MAGKENFLFFFIFAFHIFFSHPSWFAEDVKFTILFSLLSPACLLSKLETEMVLLQEENSEKISTCGATEPGRLKQKKIVSTFVALKVLK